MYKNRENNLLKLTLAVFLITISSCIQTRSITYFNNLPDSTKVQLAQLQPPQQLIQVNDVLDIQIGGENENSVAYISQFLGGGSGSMQNTVDINGNIELPKVGKIAVGGLTRDQAKDKITAAYAEYLKNPLITVKFGNFRFAVLGEVKSPGYFSVPNEKMSVLEAMAQAGDMTQYARREDVKIIRETNTKREVISLNFNDKNILNSPYYYLSRYDIIYVEPQSKKYLAENYRQTTGIIATTLSLITLLFVLIKK